MANRVRPGALSLAVLSFLLLLFTQTASAQFNAQLSGAVTDTTGAVIPGAAVKLTDNATQVVRTTTTGPDGGYSFHELPPGTYTVEVSANGFKSSTLNNIFVVAETPRSANIKLEVGGSGETVTVNGASVPALQTSDATISGTIDNEALQRIPAYGRDPYELLRTAPGITGDSARSGNRPGCLPPQRRRSGPVQFRHLPDRKPDPDQRQRPARCRQQLHD